jgi:sulfide:quinone oxidoreductase
MQILRFSPSFGVAGQIAEEDVADLAQAGFRTVVGNRPDSEGGTPMALIQAACERHGMAFWPLPVDFSTLDLADAGHFGAILARSQAPLLAYCRSGRRSAALWALAMAPHVPVQRLIDRAAGAGIALEDLRKLLEHSAAQGGPTAAGAAPAQRQAFVQRWFEGC